MIDDKNQLIDQLKEISRSLDDVSDRLNMVEQSARLEQLEDKIALPETWHNPVRANDLAKQISNLKAQVQPWRTLLVQVSDCLELLEIIDDQDSDMLVGFAQQIKAMNDDLAKLQQQLLFKGEFDKGGAVIRLSSGAGGDDAQDFTEMLERMYLRWASSQGFTTSLLERSAGETAGVKTSVIQIDGPFAYGWLKSENGVHRLVRLSPFNAESRQTSFALVEVLPQIDKPDRVVINDDDLRIDVYRASGKGGQGVNTTDSAVRLTHLPTGITVAIQSERSQIQNKAKALDILRSKLVSLQLEQHVDSINNLRAGESANFGSQIRNYVLHPYKMIKDTRTKYSQTDVEAVLNGQLQGFQLAYLQSKFNN